MSTTIIPPASGAFHKILMANPVPVVGIEVAVGHALTDKKLRDDAKMPPAKPEKKADGGGLYLHRMPTGVSTWRIKYRIAGRADEVTIGRFPEVALAEARADAAAIRRLVAAGTDPKAWAGAIRIREASEAQRAADTFRALAGSYFEANSPGWTATHQRDVQRILDELVEGRTAPDKPRHASVGTIPMRDLRKSHVRDVLDAVVARGALTYAKDVLLYCRKVVEHFNAGTDDPIADPTAGLRATIPTATERNHAALKPAEMPEFLAAMRIARCEPETRLGLRLLMLTALRTTELRLGEWCEIDFEAKKWTVPADRMKYRRRLAAPHEVPLSRQALAALRDLQALTGDRERMFPGQGGGDAVMSEGTMLMAVKRMGYAGRMTGHGLRSVFSTWAHDAGYDTAVVERALSHVDANAVRAAYDRGDRWRARVDLMQAWADRLDAWEQADNVVALRGAK
ncbi:MAG: integrase arm-type DNA-binding domain-containing protein [Burkholderiaceae bacterium]|nr:integrase arm-type DNA-binding domain-containing protein [Burkholderiaceae bacterium]